ncbi:MAG: thioredoxin family protein [Chloroflexi bacterium]|nr:thioredoxin family protein [Chloroflexota bacterium]
MASNTSVVTPQRFEEGFTYADYMAQINVNKDRMDGFYEIFKVTPENEASLKELAANSDGPTKLLVLGEDWCGDVVRGLPVLARMAEAAGWDMRVFPRDQHHDIMNEFLKEGQWMSIPTAVFYTSDHRYILHWIEKPEVAEKESKEIEEAIRAENPDINDQDFGRERRTRMATRAEAWQQATVEEIIDKLQQGIAG